MGKYYRRAIQPAMLFSTDVEQRKTTHKKISVAKMRLLWWMSGNKPRDRIRNESIRVRVQPMNSSGLGQTQEGSHEINWPYPG